MKEQGFWKKLEKILETNLVPARWVEGFLNQLYFLFGLRSWSPWGMVNRQSFICDFCRHLILMCQKQLPLPDGIAAFSRNQSQSTRRYLLADISENLMMGQPLSKACGNFPRYFTPFFCRMLRAGEQNDNLTNALEILHQHSTYQMNWWRKVLFALIYPCILLFFSGMLYIFILVFIVPRFQQLYEGCGAKLPHLSMMLIQFSFLIRYKGLWVLLLLIMFFILLYVFWKAYWTRLLVNRISLSFPIISPIIRNGIQIKFFEALEMSLRGGIPLDEAVGQSIETIPDPWIRKKMQPAIARLGSGESLSDVLESLKMVDAKTVWQLKLGQWRESLPDTLSELIYILQQKRLYHLRMIAVLEPVMILAVGIIQAFVVISLYLPLFRVGKVIIPFTIN